MAVQGFRNVGIQRKYNRMLYGHSKYMVCYLILLFLSSLVIPSIAYARLGESAEENQIRYGNPVENSYDTRAPILKSATNKTYKYQGWQIRIGYINDHAVRMYYAKLPKTGETQLLKADEIKAVLKAERHGGKWKKLPAATLFSRKNSGNKFFDNARLRWKNTNKCLAYSGNMMNLYVDTPEAIIWEQALVNEKEVQRKENIPKF